MKERKYVAFYDDGRDYGEFEFYSYHKANSKANIEDAKDKAKSKFGYKRARAIQITRTVLRE